MAKKNSGLGRGLDAIFLENIREEEDVKHDNSVSTLKISLIDPRAEQPRKNFDEAALESLATSIRNNGLFQPILVRESGFGRYQIIAGERRYRASKMAGLSEIPAIVLDKDDRETAQIALVENIQREDLNPVEEAVAYRSLASDYQMTQEELSEQVGKSRSAIANAVRLLDLPDEVLGMIAKGDLSAGAARTLLGLKNKDAVLAMAKKSVEEEWSVRRLENEVKRANKPVAEPVEEEAPVVDYTKEMEWKLQSILGRKVKIEDSKRKKTLTLYYENNEDLDDLLKRICGDGYSEEV